MSAADREREGKLLTTSVLMLLASMCDPQRLGRGRTYARQGAVIDITIEAGLITGVVQGSRSRPYDVAVRTFEVDAFDLRRGAMQALVPARRDVIFECSCPDWDDPCKHGVAVMTVFAERLTTDPQQLAVWRGAPSIASGPRATLGSRALSPAAPPEPKLSDAERQALDAFLGEPMSLAIPELSVLHPPEEMWDEPWTSMLADALHAIADRSTS